jgi:hypothetical protein
MAAVVAIAKREHSGSSRVSSGTITLDSTYVNGTGEDVTAAQLKLSRIDRLFLHGDDGYVPEHSINAAKTIANVRLMFSDNNNAADAALIEAASFDASAVVLKFTAHGKP